MYVSQDFDPIATLSGNTKLTFASTFHSLHAIATQIAPVLDSGGIETLETDQFKIHCHETHTGKHRPSSLGHTFEVMWWLHCHRL